MFNEEKSLLAFVLIVLLVPLSSGCWPFWGSGCGELDHESAELVPIENGTFEQQERDYPPPRPPRMKEATELTVQVDRDAEIVLVTYVDAEGREIRETWGIESIEEFDTYW